MNGLDLDVPGGFVSAALLAIALGVGVALSLRQLASLPSVRRVWLIVLRSLTALLALLLAVQPSWVEERADEEPGRLAVLVDVSRSMGVGAPSRFARAASLLTRWRTEPAARDVLLFGFGREVHVRSFSEPLEGLRAVEDDTRLGDALAAVADDATAAVVVSDGADLAGGVMERAERLGLRVHAVHVGDTEPLVDDAISRVDYDRVGFVRRPVRIRVELRSFGRPEHVVALGLYEDGVMVREVRAELPRDGSAQLQLEVTPRAVGRTLYRLALPHQPDDAVAENDERSIVVRVQRDELRVLHVAGRPSWDQRFLRTFLERDPTTDLISFYILRNTTDLTMADSEELALIPFPTDELFSEHLGSFDVVIFQNFDYAPYQMEGYLTRIREYVERGGSFAMIGGPLSFCRAGYGETSLAEVLPVQLLSRMTPESRALATDEFQPRVSMQARRHPLVALAADSESSDLAWSSLAPLRGMNVVAHMRADGQRLLEHPTRRDDRGEPLPVLAVGNAGRGRVLALMTDTSWHWGMPTGGLTGDASSYERFWDLAIRWLARDPSLEPARISTDRERYGPGARCRVEATLRDTAYRPFADEAVTLRVLGGDGGERSRVEAHTDARGMLEATLEVPDEPGGYRIVAERRASSDGRVARPLTDRASDPRVLAEEVFVVETGGEELADPRAPPDLLRELAARTGGTFTSLESAGALGRFDASRARVRELIRRRPFANPWVVLAAIALFGVEWIARRRWLG